MTVKILHLLTFFIKINKIKKLVCECRECGSIMETNSKELCRLCLETSADIVNVFDNFEESTIATILSKHFWFKVSKNDFSECVCGVCWTNVKSFHNFYKRVEWLHGKHSAATEETNSSSAVFHPDQRNCVLSEPDLNIVKCEETGTRFEVIDLHIKNEECSDNDNDNNVDISLDEIEDASNSSDDCDKSEIDDGAACEDKSSCQRQVETNTHEPLEESHQFVKRINCGNANPRAIQDAKIREFFDLKCNICSDDVKFQTLREFKKHNRKIHNTDGFLKCCGSTLREPSQILKHINQHSTDRAQQDAKIREFFDLKCNICSSGDDKFQTFKEFKKHYSSVHKTNGYLKCCGRTLHLRCNVLEHLQYHLNPDAYRCDRCGKQFADPSTLKSHIKIHTSERSYKCDQCTKSYASAATLKQHMEYKHSTKEGESFPCDKCNKVFPTKLSLEFHTRYVHDTSSTFICDICARVFKSKGILVNHMEVHSTRPKEQCNVCGVWLNSVYLRRHVREQHNKHNDVTVKCPTCDKVIQNKRTLTQHIRSVHCELKHKCTLCDKAFKSPKTLKEHIAIHTGEDLYDCGYCPKKFKWSGNLWSHRKKVHFTEWSRENRNGIPKRKMLSKNDEADGTK